MIYKFQIFYFNFTCKIKKILPLTTAQAKNYPHHKQIFIILLLYYKMSIVNLISFDRKSDKTDPQIIFTINNYNRRLVLSYKVITDLSVNLITSQNILLLPNNNNQYTLSIPKHTDSIQLALNISNTQRSIESFPQESKYLFALNDLSLYLTINHCNTVAIDTSGLDHKAPEENENRIQHHLGPHRSSRAMAMVHLSMMEAFIVINGKYTSYLNLPRTVNAKTEVAILQACYSTLITLYPSHQQRLNNLFMTQMNTFPQNPEKTLASIVGVNVSNAVLTNRSNDGSNHAEEVVGVDYIPTNVPGEWNKDPISNVPVALGSKWPTVKPFVLNSASIFRCPPLPGLNSEHYGCAYNEVKAVGGDGINTFTTRSNYLYETGVFWAYDGAPNLCAPPRLYNQVAKTIAMTQSLSGEKFLHMYAVINISMADTAIAAWDSKYYYKFWRPITGIRKAKQNGGDNNVQTVEDPNWTPIGAPATNSSGPNFTPPFPAYPSGHAAFGGTIFQLLRRYFNNDNITFTFVSDELNGITKDNQNNIRSLKQRTFNSLSEAEEENGQSRMYLGIHWEFDKTEGIKQGNKIADYIFDKLFLNT
jgi:hypothetical protein